MKTCAFKIPGTSRLAYGAGPPLVVPVGAAFFIIYLPSIYSPATHPPFSDSLPSLWWFLKTVRNPWSVRWSLRRIILIYPSSWFAIGVYLLFRVLSFPAVPIYVGLRTHWIGNRRPKDRLQNAFPVLLSSSLASCHPFLSSLGVGCNNLCIPGIRAS